MTENYFLNSNLLCYEIKRPESDLAFIMNTKKFAYNLSL